VLVVVSAKGVDVPLLVSAVAAFLNMRTNQVLSKATIRLAELRGLATEFLPVSKPTTALACVLTCAINVSNFHNFLLWSIGK